MVDGFAFGIASALLGINGGCMPFHLPGVLVFSTPLGDDFPSYSPQVAVSLLSSSFAEGVSATEALAIFLPDFVSCHSFENGRGF